MWGLMAGFDSWLIATSNRRGQSRDSGVVGWWVGDPGAKVQRDTGSAGHIERDMFPFAVLGFYCSFKSAAGSTGQGPTNHSWHLNI